VVAADVAWVLAAAVLLVGNPNLLAPAGQVSLAVVSVVVAVLAAAQAVGLRRRGTGPMTAASPVHLQVERIVSAPPEQVWAAISDAGDYGRFAPGIAHTVIVSGEQEGMVRVCRDDQGGEWAETCTLWEDGHRYRMTVDVSSYPTYYRWLLEEFAQTWTVEPAPDGTRLRVAFDGAVKLGVFGRAAVRMLGRQRRLDAILDNYERELTGAAGTGQRGPRAPTTPTPRVTTTRRYAQPQRHVVTPHDTSGGPPSRSQPAWHRLNPAGRTRTPGPDPHAPEPLVQLGTQCAVGLGERAERDHVPATSRSREPDAGSRLP
jgi:uncharacterized protein YndB with AHSA1/START domain